MAKALILASINKPLSFHLNNLKNNNITLTKNQTKKILQKIREDIYPSNDIFLKDISQIKISFDSEPELTEMPIF